MADETEDALLRRHLERAAAASAPEGAHVGVTSREMVALARESRRGHFAAQALAGILAARHPDVGYLNAADEAVKYADALLLRLRD